MQGDLLTRGGKVLPGNIYLNGSTFAFGVRGATCKEATGNKLVNSLFVTCEIGRMCGGVDRRMCLVVLLTIPRSLKGTVRQTLELGVVSEKPVVNAKERHTFARTRPKWDPHVAS
jgi:hypothetical protein